MDAICGLTGRLAAELSDSVEGVVFFADTADRAACEQLLTGLGLLRLKKQVYIRLRLEKVPEKKKEDKPWMQYVG